MFLNSPSLILDPLHHLVGMQVVGAAGRRGRAQEGEKMRFRDLCILVLLCVTWDSANWIRLSHFFSLCTLQSDWWFSETIHTFWVVLSKKEAYCIRIKKRIRCKWVQLDINGMCLVKKVESHLRRNMLYVQKHLVCDGGRGSKCSGADGVMLWSERCKGA